MDHPKVSVIIAVGRDNPLYEESLKKQEYPNYEVILVKGYKAAEARNIGVRRAKGNIIAFIDDDVVLPKEWVSMGVELLERSGAHIVGGPNLIFPQASISERISDFLISTSIFSGFRKKFKKAKRAAFCDYKHFATCNIMMRKGVFEKVGYFNEDYKYTEDMEFFLKCKIKGLSLYNSPDFFLYHKRRTFPFAHMKQVFLWGYGNMQMVLDYPFVFKRPDIWGSFILISVSFAMLIFHFKLAVIIGLALLPITLHFLSYSLGVVSRFVAFLIKRKR
ncbi:MAG: glycosyltransferase [Candidatus Omnitrophica bacterium]|nr:glycosyltransferase [Candidatus Omnitrophota bacterium]